MFQVRRGGEPGDYPGWLSSQTDSSSIKDEAGVVGLGRPGSALLLVGDPVDHSRLLGRSVAHLFDSHRGRTDATSLRRPTVVT